MIPSTTQTPYSPAAFVHREDPSRYTPIELGNRIYTVLASDPELRKKLELDTNDFFKNAILPKILEIRERVLTSVDLLPNTTYLCSSKRPDLQFSPYGKVSIRLKNRITYINLPHISPLKGGVKIVKYMMRISADGKQISLEMMSKIKKEKRAPERSRLFYSTSSILQTFSHPNILTPTDILFPSEKKGFELITAKCVRDLFSFLEEANERASCLLRETPEAKHRSWYIATLARNAIGHMEEITSAMQYIYNQGYFFCDLKPENILLKKRADGSLTTMLTDFDFLVRRDNLERGIKGTREYLPPYDSTVHFSTGLKNNLFSELYALGKIFSPGPSDLHSFTQLLSQLERHAKHNSDKPLREAIKKLKETILSLGLQLTSCTIVDYDTVLQQLDKARRQFITDLTSTES